MNNQKSYDKTSMGKLYLVPTPIGNLEDMTFRAVRILKEVDVIAAEDTRNTQKLLNYFEIQTPQISFHEHNTSQRIPELVERLKTGKSIAQVSDAGMTSISDPGHELVEKVIEINGVVIPLPGANAALPALIASGIYPQPFYFYGFLPRKKKDLKAELEELNKREETLIFYESPHRLKKLIPVMSEVFGENRKLALARELTKKYEEFIRGSLKEVQDWVNVTQIRGEFVIIVEGNKNAEELIQENKEWKSWTVKEHVNHLITQDGLSSKKAIKQVAGVRNLPKREVYAIYHEI